MAGKYCAGKIPEMMLSESKQPEKTAISIAIPLPELFFGYILQVISSYNW